MFVLYLYFGVFRYIFIGIIFAIVLLATTSSLATIYGDIQLSEGLPDSKAGTNDYVAAHSY